jgi:tRNA(Ile)-lysidine synthase
VGFNLVRLELPMAPGESVEALARQARYAALRNHPADIVALGHHQDDQAETLLLQLLRGAGPRGLAAMPVWQPGRPAMLRPLLAFTRAEVLCYAKARGLEWVDDESNANPNYRRNFIRMGIAPVLRQAFPGFPATLARSAAQCAEASQLLDELAAIDLQAACGQDGASLAMLRRLGAVRAKNALRGLLLREGLALPSAARLDAWWRQLEAARADARIALRHGHRELGVAKGRLVIHALAPPPYEALWRGEPALALPHGELRFERGSGPGLSANALADRRVTVRSRQAGERLRPAGKAHHRSLKNLLQEAGVPAWARAGWPRICVDEALAALPGIATAHEFSAAPGESALAVSWIPRHD